MSQAEGTTAAKSPDKATLKLIITGYVLVGAALLLPGLFGFGAGVAGLIVGILNLTKGSVLNGIAQIVLSVIGSFVALFVTPSLY